MPPGNFPPVQHPDPEAQIARGQVEPIVLLELGGDIGPGPRTHALDARGRAAPDFPPHRTPQLPPRPLPKAEQSLQTQRGVMMSLPIPKEYGDSN